MKIEFLVLTVLVNSLFAVNSTFLEVATPLEALFDEQRKIDMSIFKSLIPDSNLRNAFPPVALSEGCSSYNNIQYVNVNLNVMHLNIEYDGYKVGIFDKLQIRNDVYNCLDNISNGHIGCIYDHSQLRGNTDGKNYWYFVSFVCAFSR